MRDGNGTSVIFPPGEEIAKLVRSDTRRAELKLRAVRKAVVAHPTDGYEYLAELSRRPEDKTRVWASTWGTVVFRGRFAPVLLEILRQSKGDVWSSVLSDLLSVQPDALRSELPQLRNRLRRARTHGNGLLCVWALAQLADAKSAPLIRAFGSRPDTPPYESRTALVLADLVDAGPAGVFRYITEHRHDYVPEAAMVALKMGSADALAVLEQGAHAAADEDCRRICAVHATDLARLRATGTPPFWDWPGGPLSHIVYTDYDKATGRFLNN